MEIFLDKKKPLDYPLRSIFNWSPHMDESFEGSSHAEVASSPTETYPIRSSQRMVPQHLKPECRNRVALPLRREPFSGNDADVSTQYWAKRLSELNYKEAQDSVRANDATETGNSERSDLPSSPSSAMVTEASQKQPSNSSAPNGEKKEN